MTRGLSQRAHNKVLEAAVELFANRGIEKTSVDAIAAASGVSKATVYKHWADKEALCLEVLAFVHGIDEGPRDEDTGDLKADLRTFLLYEPPKKRADIQKRLVPHLLAYSMQNEEFGRAWKLQVMDRARTHLKNLLRRGMERGIFPSVMDVDLGVALLLGPMMYRHIFGPGIDRVWLAEGAVESFWAAHARQKEKVSGKKRAKNRGKWDGD
jgi:AcrR family transcriptional regulator